MSRLHHNIIGTASLHIICIVYKLKLAIIICHLMMNVCSRCCYHECLLGDYVAKELVLYDKRCIIGGFSVILIFLVL